MENDLEKLRQLVGEVSDTIDALLTGVSSARLRMAYGWRDACKGIDLGDEACDRASSVDGWLAEAKGDLRRASRGLAGLAEALEAQEGE